MQYFNCQGCENITGTALLLYSPIQPIVTACAGSPGSVYFYCVSAFHTHCRLLGKLFVLEPTFTFDIDNRGPKLYNRESEGCLIDDYSFNVIQKYIVTDTIPDEFKLNLNIFHDLLIRKASGHFYLIFIFQISH